MMTLEGTMDYLTVEDVNENRPVPFDAFLNYSDEDHDIAMMFSQHLESSPPGFRLFLPRRQLLPGVSIYDSMAKIIEERCKGKVIIILTENYLNSEACQFVTQFSKTLDPAAQRKQLIPVIMSDDFVDIPRTLRGMHLIHYVKDNRRGWFWDKLAKCIRLT
ncbi:myeloid differentiation primary response protein MyD88-like isoform X2 [Gigantopelta aegis]|uniref:myeloid differentiation primary response protein MyD88-like isoform X2 n=1 Tax=Gigantopelta aegis TaxID=1735272 RepID=UPI001B88E70D|nr:myeloid differentiation primary response protein MyD88-like isoform X2 [Gigantopelta aegis]